MATISLRLPDTCLDSMNEWAKRLGVTRAEYIRKSITLLNAQVAASAKQERMQEASAKIREDAIYSQPELDWPCWLYLK